MATSTIQINGYQALWRQYSTSGAAAHFCGANGFPVGVYEPLLRSLGHRLQISGLEMRATWPDVGPPPRSLRWDAYADDLIAFLDAQSSGPVIGVGHSIGAAATIYAAEKRPDLFKALVLIEPATVSRAIAALLAVVPFSLMRLSEPAKSTLSKPSCWPSRNEFVDACRVSRQFKRLSDEALQALASHAVKESGSGEVELVFSAEWEAHNYCCPPNIMPNLQSLRVPCIALRGKPSVFFTDSLWQKWQRLCPDTRFEELPDYGHLLPLEAPRECASVILDALAELD